MPAKDAQPKADLEGLLLKLYGWQLEYDERVLRLAARLAEQRSVPSVWTTQQRQEVAEFGDGRLPFNNFFDEGAHWNWIRVMYCDEAEAEIRQADEKVLGIPAFRKRMWDIAVEPVVDAARGVLPGLYIQPKLYDYVLTEYCRLAVAGEPFFEEQFSQAMTLLEQGNFAEALLRELWQECPQEATARGLPGSPRLAPMTDGQKRVWDALSARALSGKELTNELGTSEDTVRQHIQELKSKGYDVRNQRGRGYYRIDAPPNDVARTPSP